MVSTTCQACSAPATLYVCPRCVTELRANLTALAGSRTPDGRRTSGLLEDLADVVLKRTRLGGTSGHRKRGDELPAPFEPDTAQGRQTPQGRADTLLIAAHASLSAIVRDLCESRGVQCPRLTRTAQIATWLASQAHAIACDEAAGQWCADIDALVHQIEHAIDRPIGRKWLGSCPTWDDQQHATCGAELWCPADALEVYCKTCRRTHNADRLQLLLMNDLERAKITFEKICKVNKMQPDGFRVPLRTLQKWRQDGSLKPRGWLRSDGGHGITRRLVDDVPLYLWSDVRKLRERRPQKVATGAAAHTQRAEA